MNIQEIIREVDGWYGAMSRSVTTHSFSGGYALTAVVGMPDMEKS